jgi:uncharacterized membrane protein YebE (DUF533 family)
MKNSFIIYGLLIGASYLLYKKYSKKKINEMTVDGAETIPPEDIPDTDVQMPNAELGNMKVKVRTSRQTIAL